jgi:hypothetical protein
LDNFCAQRGLKPDVIKIDVEGAEIGVLEGAATTIRENQPTIFLSVHPAQIEMLGGSMSKLAALIANMGYEVRDGDSEPVSQIASGEFLLMPTRQN